MKKINFLKPRAWLILLAGLLASLGQEAFAYDFKVDGIYYNILSETDLTCEVTYKSLSTEGTSYTGEVVVPAQVEYEGKIYSVKAVGTCAFCKCHITSVSLPNSLEELGYWAFAYCI